MAEINPHEAEARVIAANCLNAFRDLGYQAVIVVLNADPGYHWSASFIDRDSAAKLLAYEAIALAGEAIKVPTT